MTTKIIEIIVNDNDNNIDNNMRKTTKMFWSHAVNDADTF